MHENYDEIVFSEPSVSFYNKLMGGPPLHPGINPAALSNEISSYFTKFSGGADHEWRYRFPVELKKLSCRGGCNGEDKRS